MTDHTEQLQDEANRQNSECLDSILAQYLKAYSLTAGAVTDFHYLRKGSEL